MANLSAFSSKTGWGETSPGWVATRRSANWKSRNQTEKSLAGRTEIPLEPQNTVGFPHATPSLTKLYKPTSGLVLYWVGNSILSPKFRPNIPSSSPSFHLSHFLDFIPHIFICCFSRLFFFPFGGKENWFCIPTGKPSKKKNPWASSRGLEQTHTDEHYIQKTSALDSAVDPTQPMQGEKTRMWMLETVNVNTIPPFRRKNVSFPNSKQAALSQSEMPHTECSSL